jgi:hypothetical protein
MKIKKVTLQELKEKINDSTIKQADRRAFEGQDSEIFQFEDNLFTKSKSGWIMAKIEKEELSTTKEENKDLITTKLIEILEWCRKYKKRNDYEISQLKKEIKNLNKKIDTLNSQSPKNK